MEQPIVIGTSHAGIAATKKLISSGYRPIVLDGGRQLDAERRQVAMRMAATEPAAWDTGELASMARNPTLSNALPRHLHFGSGYPYGDHDPDLPIALSHTSGPVPSLAQGGFSTVWGAAMLPAHDCDLTAWPIGRADLEPHYKEILSWVPMSGARDGLQSHFPLYTDEVGHLPVPPSAEALLARLATKSQKDRSDVCFGRSRLAVAGEGVATGCRSCGQCHIGCAYGSIWSASDEVERLRLSGQIDHRPGLLALSLGQHGDRVSVECKGRDGHIETITGDRLFVAAGSINSTRMALWSLNLWDRPVRLLTVQGFAAPVLHQGGADAAGWMRLASAFVELKSSRSDHWVHVQVAAPNQLAMAKLHHHLDRVPLAGRLIDAVGRHALIAAANVHSDHAGHHVMTLRHRSDGRHLMEIESIPSPEFPLVARSATRRLRDLLAGTGFHVLPPMAPKQPMSWHFGGTMPMRSAPVGPLETDRVGRLDSWSRIHFVDASVFGSIPATTIGLLSMANAARIVDEAVP